MTAATASPAAAGSAPGVFGRMAAQGHEDVHFVSDPASGYRGIIAIHDTRLGPSLGGTRLWAYESEEAALTDALRLAAGMTYKSAAAGMPFGGGKSVVIADASRIDRPALFRAHGRAVEHLGGRYITSVDIGTGPDDMVHVRRETRHVAGLPEPFGDPSPATARGVHRAILGAVKHLRGSDDLAGRTVAIQGCGHVGYHLARLLRDSGARIVASDTVAERAQRVAREFGAQLVAPTEILSAAVDVLAPCAFGAVLSATTIPQLRCSVVAGAANNQLQRDSDGALLEQHGIAYAPDFIANAGGVVYLGQEVLGWSADRTLANVDRIYDTVQETFALAAAQRIPTSQAALRIAERRLESAGAAPS